MKAAIEAEGGPFALFGGEPLMLPLADLEDPCKHGGSELVDRACDFTPGCQLSRVEQPGTGSNIRPRGR
jgi:hypothetical protein